MGELGEDQRWDYRKREKRIFMIVEYKIPRCRELRYGVKVDNKNIGSDRPVLF